MSAVRKEFPPPPAEAPVPPAVKLLVKPIEPPPPPATATIVSKVVVPCPLKPPLCVAPAPMSTA